MSATEIISNLMVCLTLLTTLRKQELVISEKNHPASSLRAEVSSEYGFVTMKLFLVKKAKTNANDQAEELYCKIQYSIQKQTLVLSELYVADHARTKEIEKFLSSNPPLAWDDKLVTPAFNEKISGYLATADRIASHGYNCASGDNYRPGNFSEISLDENRIILSQINHMNSRSSDHRDDYSLRDLIFSIALNTTPLNKSYDDQQIGEMLVNFSDRSSANLKICGDQIAAQIDVEKANAK